MDPPMFHLSVDEDEWSEKGCLATARRVLRQREKGGR